MRFIARPNAPTYPDADHSATASPMTSARPAEFDEAIWFSAGSIVPSICSETNGLSVSTTVVTAFCDCPTTPRMETSASAAGKIASTE